MRTRPFEERDWPQLQSIYRQGIATGDATFEARPKDWETWSAATRPDARLVAEMDGEVVGWAALAPVSTRAVYAGVAEVSVYVATARGGRGIGRRLLEELMRTAERVGVWTLQAGIFPENRASIALHERCGFRVVGTRERIGKMPGTGVWRDVVLMERRSAVVGAAEGR